MVIIVQLHLEPQQTKSPILAGPTLRFPDVKLNNIYVIWGQMWLITDNISHFHLTNPPNIWIQLLEYWAGCNLPFPSPPNPTPTPTPSKTSQKKFTGLMLIMKKLQYWLAEHAKKVFWLFCPRIMWNAETSQDLTFFKGKDLYCHYMIEITDRMEGWSQPL